MTLFKSFFMMGSGAGVGLLFTLIIPSLILYRRFMK